MRAGSDEAVERHCTQWCKRHLAGYTGMANLETIGGRIIEVHLRFADNGRTSMVAILGRGAVRLYDKGEWSFDGASPRTGYSVVLFMPHGPRYRHPPAALQREVASMPGVSSLQITFHEDLGLGQTCDATRRLPGGNRQLLGANRRKCGPRSSAGALRGDGPLAGSRLQVPPAEAHEQAQHEQHQGDDEQDLRDARAVDAMPPKPNTAATNATSRNIKAQYSIALSLKGSMRVGRRESTRPSCGGSEPQAWLRLDAKEGQLRNPRGERTFQSPESP